MFLSQYRLLIMSLLCLPAIAFGADRPNILWIMTDDERTDAIGAYGSPWAQTPAADRLAAAGVRFRNAIATTPVCAPVRNSMLTGMYGHNTGIMSNGGLMSARQGGGGDLPSGRKRPDFQPLTRGFIEAGYQVANFGKLHGFTNAAFPFRGPKPAYGGPASTPWELKDDRNPATFGVINLPDFIIVAGTYPLPQDQTEAGITTRQILEFIDNDLTEPFLLRVSYIAPHSPVLAPKPFDTLIDPADITLHLPTVAELAAKPRWERESLRPWVGSHGRLTDRQIRQSWATYYGLSAFVDQEMATVIAALDAKGLLDNTIIIFASDQGVEMGEHGFYMKRNFYEQTVKIPFIISWPGKITHGQVIDQQVEIIDLLPTLLDMAGLDVPAGIDGKSAWPLIQGDTETFREYTFSELDHSTSQYDNLRVNSGRRVMVRTNEWKLIFWIDREDPDGAFYHLTADPEERRNLYGDPRHAALQNRFMARARAWDAGEQE